MKIDNSYLHVNTLLRAPVRGARVLDDGNGNGRIKSTSLVKFSLPAKAVETTTPVSAIYEGFLKSGLAPALIPKADGNSGFTLERVDLQACTQA